MTLGQLIADLQALDLPAYTPVKVYDTMEDEDLGSPVVGQMVIDESGGLWPSEDAAQASADLANCVAGPGEVAVTGRLSPVAAIRLRVEEAFREDRAVD